MNVFSSLGLHPNSLTFRSAVNRKAIFAAASFLVGSSALGQAAYNGATGYINTPSARVQDDGVFRVGFSYASPFAAMFVSVQALPWLEITGRFTQIQGVPALTNIPGNNYGSDKDKSAGAKLRLLPENFAGYTWLPAVSFGFEDKGLGTNLFASYYVVASKAFNVGGGSLDASLGYGRQYIDGAFGGFRYSHPSLSKWALVAEYDRTKFSQYPSAALIGLDKRKVGRVNAAVEYSSGGWSIQVGARDGQPALNTYFTVPLEQRTLVPKINEPEPYVGIAPRPSQEEWASNPVHWQTIVKTLHEDGYRNVRIAYKDAVVRVTLTSTRQLHISRAVGRATRVILAHSPLQTERIEVTYTVNDLPTVTYSFFDIPTLQRYYNGIATRSALRSTIDLRYAQASEGVVSSDIDGALDEFGKTLVVTQGISLSRETNLFTLSRETHKQDLINIGPYFGLFLNDPSGAFKYEVGLEASAKYRLARGLFAEGSVSARLFENVTDVVQASNSLLPHVRSDVAEYKRGGRIKLNRALVNQFWQPAERIYARASAGLYEEMFGGFGAQLMYVPVGAPWSADLTVDYVAQRDFKDVFKFRSYRAFTGQLAMHVNLPYDIVATARVGRFLAKDSGVRLEIKRHFASGIEMGAWYSRTNAMDITSPGTPGSPYRDKGIFMSIPIDTLLTRNNGVVANFSLSPWTRDPGQMVQSPADLRLLLERGLLRNVHEDAGMRGFGDIASEDRP